MVLNQEKIKQLMEERGWSEILLANKLGLDYSYVYRVLRSERGVGRKFLTGLIKLCDSEGLDFREFVYLE